MPCNACGVCCDLYGHTLSASAEDLARWRREGRDDLVAAVAPDGRLWWDAAAGRLLDHCPHFTWRGSDHGDCAIHPTKPAICRGYPTPAHGRRCIMGVTF